MREAQLQGMRWTATIYSLKVNNATVADLHTLRFFTVSLPGFQHMSAHHKLPVLFPYKFPSKPSRGALLYYKVVDRIRLSKFFHNS